MLRLSTLAKRVDNSLMRGMLLTAALFLALLTTPVWAQRGGGGHGGMGGGSHGAVTGGGHTGGMVSGSAHSTVVPGAGNGYHGGGWGSNNWHGNGWHGNNWNGNGWHGNGWNGNGWNGNGWNGRHYPYRPWRWGWGWGGYPYWGWGTSWAFYPGWDWYGDAGAYDPSVAYDEGSPGQPYAPAYPSTVYLAPDGAVEYSQSAQSAGPSNPAAPPASPKMTEVHYDTVLVYRDGHTEKVENYGIVGKTVWVFTESRARKIPLSTLDIPATQRDNQDRGGEFVLPGPSQ